LWVFLAHISANDCASACGIAFGGGKIKRYVAALAVAVLLGGHAVAQTSSGSNPDGRGATATNPWSFSDTADVYVVPYAESFVSPTLTADHDWLHLEARYNYENQYAGSLWVGYNFSAGDKLVFEAAPMIGGVFGNTTGIAPGIEMSLTYKRVSFSSSAEYVFDTRNRHNSFFYAWPQLTYKPVDWIHLGLVAQRTKAYHTRFDTQRGFLIGLSHKKMQFTTYVFNPGWSDPTLVLELAWSF
jgi:hypothetical protein